MINDKNTHDEFTPIIKYTNMHYQTAFSAFYSLLVKVQTNHCSNWGKEKQSQFCTYNWSVYGSFATITQKLIKLTSFVPFTKNNIFKLTKYGLSPKGFCIFCSVTQIIVKTYDCSCNKNVYLCWCSNVYW